MRVEDLYVVAEGARLAINDLEMTLEFLEVRLADRACVHIKGILALKPDERGLDVEVEREFAVIEHGQEHGVVAAVAQPGECAAQSLWITQKITEDHEERAVGGLGKELIDARPGREARLHWLG